MLSVNALGPINFKYFTEITSQFSNGISHSPKFLKKMYQYKMTFKNYGYSYRKYSTVCRKQLTI